MKHQPSEGRRADRDARRVFEPGADPHEIDRGRRQEMLEVGLQVADIATTPLVEATDPLRNRSFHPRPLGILNGEFLGRLALPCFAQSLVSLLRA